MLTSAITTTTMLGFTLMALLIMSVPFTSMNFFSDAIAAVAMNYDGYQNSMRNSDSSRTDYYQKQEQQQSNYDNYDYDENNKKISYNNSYDNDNSKYSKYPTKDKKIACQTGQFEGFFVESEEFCDLKIEQNPPALSQILPETVYTTEGPINTTSAFNVITSSALCNPGDIAVSGGITIFTGQNSGLSNVVEMTSEPTLNDSEWFTRATGHDITIISSARCFDNP